MASRSEAQQARRERERRQKRAIAAQLGWRKHAARISEVAPVPVSRRNRAQNTGSIEQGQTEAQVFRGTAWKNGSEYVCLICRLVTHGLSCHMAHVSVGHLGCEEVRSLTWLEPPHYYEGPGLVVDSRPSVNVWMPA